MHRVVRAAAGAKYRLKFLYTLPRPGVCHAVAVTKCRLQFLYTFTNLSHATTCLSVFAFDALRAMSHSG